MKLIKFLLIASMALPVAAVAAPLSPGQWTASFYTAKGALMFDAGVCFVNDNTWYMTTQTYTAGRWNLVGNNIRIHGSNVNSNGAGELTRITSKFMAGPWQSWTDDDAINLDLVSKWEFNKQKCDPAAPPE